MTGLMLGLGLALGSGGGGTVQPVPGATATFAVLGDSGAARYLEDYADASSANANVLSSNDGVTFTQLAAGAAGMNTGNAVQIATGKTIRYVNCGASGRTLADYLANTSSVYSLAITKMQAAGMTASNGAVIISLMHNDATSNLIVSLAQACADLRTLVSNIRASLSAPTLQIFFMGVIPCLNAANATQARLARAAVQQVGYTDSNVRFLGHTYDASVADAVGHPDLAGWLKVAPRFSSQLIAWLNGTAQVSGPYFASMTAVSLTQTRISLAFRGAANDFTPTSGLTGITISGDAFATTDAVSAAARDGAGFVLVTHAADASANRSLRYMDGIAPTVSGVLIDNTAAANSCDPTINDLTASFAPTYGPNLQVNGDFSLALPTGYFSVGADCSIVSGQLVFTFTSSTNSTIDSQYTGLVIGQYYTISFNVVSIGVSALLFRVGTAQGGSTLLNRPVSATGSQFFTFQATATTHWLRIRAQSTGCSIDNISMRLTT